FQRTDCSVGSQVTEKASTARTARKAVSSRHAKHTVQSSLGQERKQVRGGIRVRFGSGVSDVSQGRPCRVFLARTRFAPPGLASSQGIAVRLCGKCRRCALQQR
ncbi:MAG: hypothetical protein RMJ19_00050, partial [Gemmatales bacterium]|nr:hypothetical protein [Gemmatales bacterium]MDW8174036.1 hypothetical protein [Gemmatales bacterium]